MNFLRTEKRLVTFTIQRATRNQGQSIAQIESPVWFSVPSVLDRGAGDGGAKARP
jgi:hypothetical protein